MYTPKYEHGCEGCVPLKQTKNADYYVCNQGSDAPIMKTVLGRDGNGGHEYWSFTVISIKAWDLPGKPGFMADAKLIVKEFDL